MPKIIFKIFLWLILGSISLGIAYSAGINVNIPGSNPTSTGPFGTIGNLYELALGISGLLAFGSIVYGAIVYTLAAGNPSGQNEGKEWIKQALLGLLLLVGAYIILNTINPALVRPGLSLLDNIGERVRYNPPNPPPPPPPVGGICVSNDNCGYPTCPSGSGVCEGSGAAARCQCTTPPPAGETCANDAECLLDCLPEDGVCQGSGATARCMCN